MDPAIPIRRLAAWMVDQLIGFIISFICGLFIGFFTVVFGISKEAIYYFITSSVYALAVYIYFVYFEQSHYQATLGKKLLRLKVVELDDYRMSFGRSVVRCLFSALPVVAYNIFKFYMGASISLVVFVVLLMIWLLPIFFTKEKVCLHDLLSKTRVKYCPKSHGNSHDGVRSMHKLALEREKR